MAILGRRAGAQIDGSAAPPRDAGGRFGATSPLTGGPRLSVAKRGRRVELGYACCCDVGPATGPRPKGERGAGWAGQVRASNCSRPRLREGKENPFSFYKTRFINYFTKLISKTFF